MGELEENNKELLEDRYLIATTSYRLVKVQKQTLEDFCRQIAALMDDMKSETGKQELAEITQSNYKSMIELEIQLGQLENAIKGLDFLRRTMF